MPDKSVQSKRITGADGMRALACLGVFAAHAIKEGGHRPTNWFESLLLEGHHGVAVFFVLSGFLLSIPFWKGLQGDGKAPNLKVYTVRRLGRIVPGYYLCVGVLALVMGLWATTWGLFEVVTTGLFVNTFFRATYLPVWDKPLWSISIEMQFYVLLPLFAWGLYRIGSGWAARVYCVGTIVFLCLAQVWLVSVAPQIEIWVDNASIFTASSWAVERNSLILFTHFLIGVMAADGYLALRRRLGGATTPKVLAGWRAANRFDLLAVSIAIGLCLLVLYKPGVYEMFGFAVLGWPLVHLMAGGLLVTLPFSVVVGPWLDIRFLRLTADLSFGIYMWHLPILTYFYSVGDSWGLPSRWNVVVFGGAALVCTYAVAFASYQVIEKPVLRAAHRYRPG